MNNDFENQIANPEKEQTVNDPEKEQTVDEVKEKMLTDVDINSDSVINEGEDMANSFMDLSQEENSQFSEIKSEITDLRTEAKADIEEIFNENKETPENFKEAALVLLKSLRAKENAAKEGYVFTFGSSTEQTSQGKEINVDSLSWLSDDGFATDNKQRLVLVATDKIDGRVVGLRLSDIRKDGIFSDENGNYINKEKISGEILTRWRGEGLAPALDNAFLKTVTKVANYYQQNFPANYQFNWEVENANLKRLEEKKTDGLSEDKSDELELEQKRWQSVYGENGKLGFKKDDEYKYSKIVEPKLEAGISYDMEKVDFEKYQKIEESLEEFSE